VCDLSFDRFSFVFGREEKKMRATFFRLAFLEKMKSRCAGGGISDDEGGGLLSSKTASPPTLDFLEFFFGCHSGSCLYK
jgi:hypothetical protein